MSIDR